MIPPCSPNTESGTFQRDWTEIVRDTVGVDQQRNQRVIIAADALDQAAPLLIETLTHHWESFQGTRVRHILWSLHTGRHIIDLDDVCRGIDADLADALLAAIAAKLFLGAESDKILERILQVSGEIGRFHEVERVTPDHLPVPYPLPPFNASSLRKMADAVDYVC